MKCKEVEGKEGKETNRNERIEEKENEGWMVGVMMDIYEVIIDVILYVGAYSPSKVRKTTKKGRIRKRKDNVAIEKNKEAEERRGKILEEKEKREDELRLLKEREEEQSRLHEVVKEKQRYSFGFLIRCIFFVLSPG